MVGATTPGLPRLGVEVGTGAPPLFREKTTDQFTCTIRLERYNIAIFANSDTIATVIHFYGTFNAVNANTCAILPVILRTALDADNAD